MNINVWSFAYGMIGTCFGRNSWRHYMYYRLTWSRHNCDGWTVYLRHLLFPKGHTKLTINPLWAMHIYHIHLYFTLICIATAHPFVYFTSHTVLFYTPNLFPFPNNQIYVFLSIWSSSFFPYSSHKKIVVLHFAIQR